MGYGHLRAAMPLADELGIELCHADQPPFADQQEEWLWTVARGIHRLLSKPTRLAGLMGKWARTAMDAVTLIPPLHESSDLSAPGAGARLVGGLVDLGLGRGLGRFGDTFVYASNGTGYWGPPMRLGVPAEITQVILRHAEGSPRAQRGPAG